MDYETVSAENFGGSLRGMGINLLVRDVRRQSAMLEAVFGMTAHRVSADFAIIRYGATVFQLHSDGTYAANPYLSFLPEAGPRGAGAELRLYDSDPDTAAEKAEANGMLILQPPTDKPHGLREAFLICPDGYAWVPSRPL
ncbi:MULTISPECIES: VOC family protein [Mameliella]|uniref:VOC family protein n=1 Tax=Mameliella TaxID=1434019 RepID=UPI000B529803|nr:MULTISPECIES: VOC family protein [Mameliella]MCR9275236.1 glyoxalase [Paracoccaceae bacterium]OWV59112.1 glyoxalase [Mameliella alba]